jgi:hypothetical protein
MASNVIYHCLEEQTGFHMIYAHVDSLIIWESIVDFSVWLHLLSSVVSFQICPMHEYVVFFYDWLIF